MSSKKLYLGDQELNMVSFDQTTDEYIKEVIANDNTVAKTSDLGFGKPQNVTFPFTAPSDGILKVVVNPNTSNVAIYYVSSSDSAENFSGSAFTIITTAGAVGTTSSPVKKSNTYTNSVSNNIREYKATFYPLGL